MRFDRLADAEPIFQSVVHLPPESREPILAERCGADAELLTLVKHLLALHDRGLGSFLQSPADETASRTIQNDPRESTSIGPYRILETIGEGGMGTVYHAEQSKPIHRKVALKVIKPGMDSKQVIARFEVEREALALMDHPNIAKVLDAGETEQHRPYFVMDLVQGEPITDYCDRHTLSTWERLELFIPVCRAVQHAHQKGIIHRDLKPSNILVTMSDGKPVPKVIDFGIAKATSSSLTEKTLFTQQGQLIGTPAYMSPEQAEMGPLDVDTRSDVYSLGVILYELLAGVPPFDPEALRKAGLAGIQRILREVEPPTPSTKVSTGGAASQDLAERHCTDTRTLTHQLRGELDWIVLMAMDKDRARRYETATGLARDIERYLNNEPVTASPPSATYRVRKFAQRHHKALISLAAVFVTLLVGISATTWQAARATHEAKRARAAEKLAADRYRIAKTGMDRYVTIVMEDAKLQRGFVYLRDRLLLEAVPLYEELVNQNVEATGERRHAASTLVRLGTLHAAMGEHRAGITEYARAVQMLRQVDPAASDTRLGGVTTLPFTEDAADESELSPETQQLYIETIGHLRAHAPELEEEPEYVATLATAQAVLGDWLARAGRWKEASRQFQQSIELASDNFERAGKAATLFLVCNQIEEHERLCREIQRAHLSLQNLQSPSPVLHTFPDQWIFLLSPTGIDGWTTVIESCDRIFSDPELASLMRKVAAIQIGCAEYRMGHVHRSIEWLTEYADEIVGDYNPVKAHIFLAMALHSIGKSEEAMKSLHEAQLLMDEYDQRIRSADLGLRWCNWIQSRILYQEAVTVLRVADERESSPRDAYAQLLNRMQNDR